MRNPAGHSTLAAHTVVWRRAFTLVELVVAVATASIVLAGLASALFLASRALPGEERPTDKILHESRVADQILAELQYARYITERSTNAIAFTVADRDGDGAPERIRYAWSGTPGDPLTRRYNNGSTVTVLEDVHQFDLTYDLTSVTEEYLGASVEGAEQVLSSHSSVEGGARGFTITEDEWPGQYFQPSLPADAVSWRVTRVLVSVKQKESADGVTLVQLRTVDGEEKPTDTVLGEQVMDEADLGSPYEWYEVTFNNVGGLSPGQGLCLVLKHGGGGSSAKMQYDDGGGSGAIDTEDAGGTWSFFSWISRLYYVYGKVSTPGSPQTATRQYVTGVRLALQAGTDTADRIDAAVRTLNAPEVLSAVWEVDFDADPTLDHNGDGVSDWMHHNGSDFDVAGLESGVWEAVEGTPALDTYPNNDFAELTTVELRFRNPDVGGNGAVFWINADWSDNTLAPLFAFLQLQSDDTQTLTVYHKLDGSTDAQLVTVPGLPDDFVTLRLLIDPDLDTANVRVDGVDRGTYFYNTFAPPHNDRFASVLPSGSDAEFDYVSVRVGASDP